jgi:hypothetical protein
VPKIPLALKVGGGLLVFGGLYFLLSSGSDDPSPSPNNGSIIEEWPGIPGN